MYSGGLKGGEFHGYGKKYTIHGLLIYEGQFFEGQIHGENVSEFSDGGVKVFQGNIHKAMKQGYS